MMCRCLHTGLHDPKVRAYMNVSQFVYTGLCVCSCMFVYVCTCVQTGQRSTFLYEFATVCMYSVCVCSYMSVCRCVYTCLHDTQVCACTNASQLVCIGPCVCSCYACVCMHAYVDVRAGFTTENDAIICIIIRIHLYVSVCVNVRICMCKSK
jgi:hypothetical protein